MFESSIENVAGFTRPLHSIVRSYGNKKIIPGSATLFFVNEDGWAITCKHVTDLLATADSQSRNYSNFKNERSLITNDPNAIEALELKYQYKTNTIVQVKNTFMDCVDKMEKLTWQTHPRHDLALLQFHGFGKTLYSGYARFVKDSTRIRQGNYLCRLGFPFPEFTNFSYNEALDDIEWSTIGIQNSPRFPLEGMVTRFLAEDNKMYGIEMSTPGLRGQSGGPLFDKEGIIYGMQFSTKHLHLGFDMVDKEIRVNNEEKIVSDYSFIHLGQCIHADIIKEFLREKNVKFYEE